MMTTVYLEKLLSLRDNFSVKVITGFRGTGKTFLLKKLSEKFISEGVPAEAIIFMDFENERNFADYRQLYEHINTKIVGLETAYLLFDEVENVDGWEKAVNAFFLGAAVEIYITGTNEKSLLEKLAPLLPDNYDVLRLYPLSFAEYMKVRPANRSENVANYFSDYLKFGGLPLLSSSVRNLRVFQQVLIGSVYEAVFRDVVVKHSLRSPEVFYLILQFLATKIGENIKVKDVDRYVASKNVSATPKTIDTYLKLIADLNFFVKLPRYDVNKGSHIAGEQFYCIDTGLCSALCKFEVEETAAVKNAVCLELVRRGYQIACPKIGNASADFWAVSGNSSMFIQIVSADDETSLSKALKTLYKLPGNVDKFLLSIEPIKTNYGVKNVSVIDFLLNKI